MPSPPYIDIDALLAPLAGDNPAGDTVPFILRKKMDDARKEVNPDSFAPDDPRRPDQPIVADWQAIQRMTVEALTNTSKDLMAAARLTESLTKQYGFGGLRDGLTLLRRMVEDCWDRINPIIEDGDLEPRGAAFNWLGDPDRGAFFPGTVRQVPIVELAGVGYGWQNWRDLQDGKGKVAKEDFDKAVAAAKREACALRAEDLEAGLAELDALGLSLDAKMADNSPSLAEIRRAMTDCQTLVQEILSRKGPAPVALEEVTPAASETTDAAPSQPRAAAPRGNTREEIYVRLGEAAAELMRIEPHSPVAYMVQRAVKLGHLTLPDLIKVLIKDQEVLKQLNRDLDLGLDQSE